jgi:phospholipid/cholesterol/gamma-HCH transport system substrate-binding protein
VLFLVIALAGVSFVGARYAGLGRVLFGQRGCTITADFPDSGGIFSNAEVTYRGVGIGQVGRLHLREDGVRVDLVIRSCTKAKIPQDSIAVVSDRSAVGEQYVDIRPRSNGGPYLRAGDAVPGPNLVPISTQVLLTNLDRLVRSIDPAKLAVVINELGAAFGNRGPALQQLLDSGDQLLTAAEQALPETLQLIEDASTVLKTQLDEGSAIRSWAQSLRLLTAQLKSSDPDLRTLLNQGPSDLTQVLNLMRDNRSDLAILLANLATTGQVLTRNLDGLEEIFIQYPSVVAGGYTVAGSGTAHFGLVINFDNPPPCEKGYEGTVKRGAGQTSPTAPNVYAACTEPRGSKTEVRGAQNTPGGDPVYTGGAGIVPTDQSGMGDASAQSRILADRGWIGLLLAPLS